MFERLLRVAAFSRRPCPPPRLSPHDRYATLWGGVWTDGQADPPPHLFPVVVFTAGVALYSADSHTALVAALDDTRRLTPKKLRRRGGAKNSRFDFLYADLDSSEVSEVRRFSVSWCLFSF